VKSLSDNLDSRISKVNERLSEEKADMQNVESLISERIRDVHKDASVRESKLQKEIIDSRKRTEESVDARFGKIRDGLALDMRSPRKPLTPSSRP